MKKIILTEEQIKYIQYYLKNGILMLASNWEIKNYSDVADIAEGLWLETYNNHNYEGTDHLIEWLWQKYVEQEKDNCSFEGMLMERENKVFGHGIVEHCD